VEIKTMDDARMQNMALLGAVSKNALIPGVTKVHFDAALEDLLSGDMLKKNRAVFDAWAV
jgi:Pyruvate/2-oxoacid:ferredoxin oxidoreductase gamma subunit